MIKLINNTKGVSRIGGLVVKDPQNNNGFVYAPPNSSTVIGVITQAVPYRSLCTIATIGDTARVFTQGNVVAGNVIRAAKSGDNISLGFCGIAKPTDAPYLKIGDALTSGKGLISCILELIYVSGTTTGDFVTDGTYTIGLGILTDGVIEVKNGIIISLIEAT